MNHLELQQTSIDSYKLGVSYCRTLYEKEGVCIFVQEGLRYVKIDMEKHCKDKDFEVCVINTYFNAKLVTVLRKLYTVTTEYIICCDINIDYLVTVTRKLN
jgi:hypothetical protein